MIFNTHLSLETSLLPKKILILVASPAAANFVYICNPTDFQCHALFLHFDGTNLISPTWVEREIVI
jgi:hypothetical protein